MKRLTFWILLAAAILLAAWWAFRFPYSPDRLYRAMPPNALWVGEHPGPFDRWQSFAAGPLGREMLVAAGVKPEDLDNALRQPGLQRVLSVLGTGRLLAAYVPAIGPFAEPAWIFAGRVGGYSQLLRWGFLSRQMKDFDAISLEDGRRAWTMKVPGVGNGEAMLAITVLEGVLVGCVSADLEALRSTIARVDGAGADTAPLLKRLHADGSEGEGILDRLWVNWYARTAHGFARREALCVLTSVGEAGLAGTVTRLVDPEAPSVQPTREPQIERGRIDRLGALAPLLGQALDAVAVVPAARASRLADTASVHGSIRSVLAILEGGGAPEGLAFAGLLRSEFSGRILGLKVPAFIVGMDLQAGTDVAALVGRALDRLNSQYGWALIPRAKRVGEHDVIVIDGTRAGIYSSVRPDERVAFVDLGGWLVLCSNVAALEGLLTRSEEATPEACPWMNGLDRHDSDAYAWADLDAAGEAVKNGVAAYSLVLLVRQARGDESLRETVTGVGRWIDAVRPLRTCRFWLVDGPGSGPALRFEVGALAEK